MILSAHPDLVIAQELVYNPCGLAYNNLVHEKESQAYGACTFTINGKAILFRVAKITPTKAGQFVTLWKRTGSGPIMPYDVADAFDMVIISVRQNQRLGQFVFPKSVLYTRGLLSKNTQGGKRAMRIYPPWDTPKSMLAQKTQAWQCQYFFEVERTNPVAVKNALLLLSS